MSGRKLHLFGIATVLILVTLTGCFSMPWTRTGNQGGGSLVTAVAKLTSGKLGVLTPDEIQILTDAVRRLADVDVPPVTDEQAAAVVKFLDDNNVETVEDLEALIKQAEEDPSSIVISDEVREVIEQIIANADQYQDLENAVEVL